MALAVLYPIVALVFAYVYPALSLAAPILYLAIGIVLIFVSLMKNTIRYNFLIVGVGMSCISIASITSMALSLLYFGSIIAI